MSRASALSARARIGIGQERIKKPRKKPDTMTMHSLICPFLSDDPAFAYGVEFGMLYSRMRNGEDVIEDYFCRANQDQILLLASRLRWRVIAMTVWGRDWIRFRLEKGAQEE
jgi:hypothetical protein